MRFARRVFLGAAVYGVLVLLPQYFLEGRIAADTPPPITHPEFFYGFIGVALAWQVLFFLIARDPPRYRPAMVPAVLEKLAFGCAGVVLFVGHRLALQVVVFALVDLVFAALFIVAFAVTPTRSNDARIG